MKEIAKKTLAKIEKEQVKLDALVAKRDEYNAMVQAKLAEMNDEIKKQEKVIATLREQEKTEKLDAVATLMDKNGVTVDDLLTAVVNRDLYAIQEMIEKKGKPAEQAEEIGEPADEPTADVPSASYSASREREDNEKFGYDEYGRRELINE